MLVDIYTYISIYRYSIYFVILQVLLINPTKYQVLKIIWIICYSNAFQFIHFNELIIYMRIKQMWYSPVKAHNVLCVDGCFCLPWIFLLVSSVAPNGTHINHVMWISRAMTISFVYALKHFYQSFKMFLLLFIISNSPTFFLRLHINFRFWFSSVHLTTQIISTPVVVVLQNRLSVLNQWIEWNQ